MKCDIYQVYRSLTDYNCNDICTIPKNTLLQIERIDRTTSIALRPEGIETYYWIQARELLNEENFQRVF